MLKYGNRELRNLEEQVEKNAQDIEDFKNANQTIAEFGIYVIGVLASVDDLPAQGENFGDAYLIGSSTPYDMRVWTRDVAHNTAKWVDLGSFPLKGDKGAKGERGSVIYVDAGEPLNDPTSLYDFYIDKISGYWYQPYSNETGYSWLKAFTLKGEKGDRGLQGKQGVQGVPGVQGKTGAIGAKGDKGDKGDTGAAFYVQGTLASSSNLPTPTAEMQDKGYAYLIPDTEGTKHIWVIQGSESTSFSWVDIGTSGVGIQGEKGADGIGLNNLTDTNLTYGNITVTYNTTDGIGINGIMRQTYGDTNHDSTVDMNIPLVPGNGILIDKQAGTERVEVKIDQSKNFSIYGNTNRYFTADTSASFALSEGSIYTSYGDENGIPTISHKDPGGTYKYNFPTNVAGTHRLLSNNNVKTLFGKSIVGEDNIDLYQHVITATDSDNRGLIMLVYSSNNLNVKSLADLKTLLGNTFNYPASGWSSDYVNPNNPSGIITRVTETTIYGLNPVTIVERTLGTWDGFTITDDVKTV